MGEVVVFGTHGEAEDFFLRMGEQLLQRFTMWLEVQPEGASLLADMAMVDDALGHGYEGEYVVPCAAACRVEQAAGLCPFGGEMVLLFGSLHDAWGMQAGLCLQCDRRWVQGVERCAGGGV